MSQTPELLPASPAEVLRALATGGRAAVTVRSRESGQHVSIVLSVRKRNPDGGWVSRATKAGRVGIANGDVVEARDPSVDYPDNYVGRLYLADGEWKAGSSSDPIRVWVAERVLRFGLAGVDQLTDQADVLLATQCCYCGKGLRDPESIERGVGPECFGKRTKSKRAPDQLALEGGEESDADFNRRWAEHKNEFARREAEQEAAAYEAEAREEAALGLGGGWPSRPVAYAAREADREVPPCMACGRPDDHDGRCAI